MCPGKKKVRNTGVEYLTPVSSMRGPHTQSHKHQKPLGFIAVFIRTHQQKKNIQLFKTTSEHLISNTLECATAGSALGIFITQNGVGGGWACPTASAASRHLAISGLHSVISP